MTNKVGVSLRSARAILPELLRHLDVRSILDVGCGAGAWLAAARELGVEMLTGVEGPWAKVWFSNGVLPRSEFDLVTQDLEDRLELDGTFDFTICLEVAEHLSESRGRSLIADLCTTSDLVLFGAAIPGQGGVRHLNEQWQSHWAELFREQRFAALDVVRPRFWSDRAVAAPYKQNALLYAKEGHAVELRERLGLEQVLDTGDLDLVHPHYYRKLMHPWLRPLVRPGRFRSLAASLGPRFAHSVTSRLWRT